MSLSLSLGILGQVWYLIVSIPDLFILTYFYSTEVQWDISDLPFVQNKDS